MMKEKAVTYHTHWKFFYGKFVLGWALTPLLGLGFIQIYQLKKRLKNTYWSVYNDRITQYSENESRILTIPLEKLDSVSKSASEKEKKHGLASLKLISESATITIEGIAENEADHLESALASAIQTAKQHRMMKEKIRGDYENIKIGGLEHLNTLVGMWQEGLISEEDFEKEKRKFEKEG